MSNGRDIMPGFTTKFSLGSFLSTLNPLSRLAGNRTTQYVPQWLVNAIAGSNTAKGDRLYQATQTAHLLSKIVGASATAGLLTWLIRAASQKADDAASRTSRVNKANRTAGEKLQSQFKKPTEALISTEDIQQPQLKKQASAYSLLAAALPSAAAVVTALSVLAITDKQMDQSYGSSLQNQRQNLQQKLDNIMLQRVYRNRNVSTRPALQSPIKKSAKVQGSGDRSILGLPPLQTIAGIGLLAIAVIAAKAGYNYDRQNNPAVLKYNANKKGLKAFVKAKQAQQNIYNKALDPKLVAVLDSGLSGAAPRINESSNSKQLYI